MTEIDVSHLGALKEYASSLSSRLKERQILLLEGPVGAGKTQLTYFLVEALGGGEVSSPSFAIHNCYPLNKFDIDHVDLYRLRDDEDIESTGFWDLFEKEKGLIIIEWPSKINRADIPTYWDQKCIKFSLIGEARTLVESTP